VSRIGEEDEVSPKFNEEGNPVNVNESSKSGASNTSTLEDLMRKLEKLTAKNKRLRAKGKKTKGSSSSSKEENSSCEENVSKKGRKEEEIMISLPIIQCLLITIICQALPLILPYQLAKLHVLMELIIINGSIA
jgi:predicted RNase H-like nuclease (RuvC/YqgF family)